MLNCMSCYRPVGFEYFTLNPTIDGMLHPRFSCNSGRFASCGPTPVLFADAEPPEQRDYLCMECVKIIRNGGVVDGDGLRVNRRSTPTPGPQPIPDPPATRQRRRNADAFSSFVAWSKEARHDSD